MKKLLYTLFVLLPFVSVAQTDAGISNILSPNGSICDSSIVNPIVELKNFGTDSIISVDIYYNIDGGTEYLFQWTGLLLPGAVTQVYLQAMNTTLGIHTFQAYTSYPNFLQDLNAANDLNQSTFSLTGSIGIIPGAGTNKIVTTCPGKTVFIAAHGGLNYNWLSTITGNSENDTVAVTVSESTTFYVEILGANCKQFDSVKVVIDFTNCEYGVISNNVFTPDNDGVNDGFIFDIPQLIQHNNRVTIYNKWGDIIQEFSNYDNVDVIWKGNDKSGGKLNSGTYFYIIEIKDINYSNSGWIQLVR